MASDSTEYSELYFSVHVSGYSILALLGLSTSGSSRSAWRLRVEIVDTSIPGPVFGVDVPELVARLNYCESLPLTEENELRFWKVGNSLSLKKPPSKNAPRKAIALLVFW